MKSLMHLWQEVLQDLGDQCHVSTDRDLQTALSRVKHEGEKFLTVSLPLFGKDFERSLDEGRIADGAFVGWAKTKSRLNPDSPRTPRFLVGFMQLVFDVDSGWLLEEPDIDAIFAIRQLTLMNAKLLKLPDKALIEKAIEGYIECEQELRRLQHEISSSLLEEFRKASLVLFGGVLQQVDEDVYHCRITPNHGPGATADRLRGNEKFDQFEWPERLDEIFPFGEYIVANPRHHMDVLPRVRFLEPGEERPVRVVPVPKTATTARIIAMEPTCMQYVQQGLMARFVEYLESRNTPKGLNPAFGMVGFEDQVPNQNMARIGSEDGSLATLDLSEASDRVTLLLVQTLTATFPHLRRGLEACRSTHADVPGHGVLRLVKFASMGSAVTFPVEAMVFLTVAVMGIAKQLNQPVSPGLLRDLEDSVRIYGDDIIVPVESVPEVILLLETFGFKVNKRKSFWTGKFRESCGREFYDGQAVSIAKVRRELPTSLHAVEEIISTVSLRNQFYELGLWRTARWLDDLLESVLNGHYPIVTEESPVLGRVSVSFGYETQRMHPTLHSPLVKGFVPKSKSPVNPLDGHGALLKCLLKQGDEPFADSEHLHRSGRPRAVSMKLGWFLPY
jgi:hypothetical protein